MDDDFPAVLEALRRGLRDKNAATAARTAVAYVQLVYGRRLQQPSVPVDTRIHPPLDDPYVLLGETLSTMPVRSPVDVTVPLLGKINPLVVYVLLLPLIIALRAKLNVHLLAHRKARGRDIEEEEKYENTTAGIISLRPVDHESELNSDRRF